MCFRHYTVEEASKWGIAGTVRNMWNGDVEVYAQGDEASMAKFEQFLHIGPRSARVDSVVKEIIEDEEVYRGFDISW